MIVYQRGGDAPDHDMTLVVPERGVAWAEERVVFEREQVMRLTGYLHALRHHLRDERDFEDHKRSSLVLPSTFKSAPLRDANHSGF